MNQASHYIGTLSPEMALLGLLFGEGGHGYDLHRKVVSDLGQVWHLSQSQAYAILKRLEAQGDISVEAVAQERLPARQLYQMTGRGRERFLGWLNTPSGGSTRAIRLEFVTRLYFLGRYFPEEVDRAFGIQRDEAIRHSRRLEGELAGLAGEAIYNRMSLDLRLRQLQAVVEWLERYRAEFGVANDIIEEEK